ncbi:hypothetical protein C8R44DRAFT_26254 [Mycena epipterygia]|nr:hypothetical protein C8R44DRAFT_26254 [Mycena epipterygia]
MFMQEEDEEDELINDTLFANEHGQPLRFYLHSSIKQPGARLALQAKIELYGGAINDPIPGSNEATPGTNIILLNTGHPSGNLEGIRHAYKAHSNPDLSGLHVEPMRWIDSCIKNGRCEHRIIRKGMGGLPGGGDRERTEFTADDDEHLVQYLGTLIPDKSEGGRLGNNIYKSLMSNAEILPDEYDWALRHTWQSWRERYKKNQNRFDSFIKESGVGHGVEPHQKYHLSRKAINRSARQKAEDDDSAEEEEGEEIDAGVQSQKHPMPASGSIQRNVKRRRIDRSHSPDNVGEDGGNTSKGKQKAPPPPDDEDDDSDGSLFGGEDPGPSNTSPPPQARLPTPGVHSSQLTLVGTSPQHNVLPHAQISTMKPTNIEEPPPRQQQTRSTRLSGTRSPLPQPAPRAKRNFQPVPEIVEVQAPYRSTRARSRPLEPYVNDVDAIMRKDRQNERKKALEPVEEIQVEEEERDRRSREPEGTGETQEEQNVEEFLMDANEQSGISDVGNAVEELEEDRMPPPHEIRRARRSPLETDDEQTDLALRRRQVSSPVARSSAASNFGGERIREVLEILGGPRLSRPPESVTSKAASSSRFAQNSLPDVFSDTGRRGSTQVPSIDFRNPLYTQSAGRASVSRKDSGSSAEFPTPGTRASLFKHETKAHEKRTPYRPPAGTRAAALAIQR